MAQLKNIPTFDFDDVRLLPKKAIVESRSVIDTQVKFGGRTFEIPVVPANMSTIIDEKLAIYLAQNNHFYVMHRFDVDPVDFTKRMHDKGLYSSVSFGIKQVDFDNVERFAKLSKSDWPEYITVDVAHGHSETVIKVVAAIAEKLPEVFIIAGNVATGEAARELEAAGAHAAKVGIGPGSACLTAPNTGFGTQSWQLSAIQEVSQAVENMIIIADGGIRHYGDIAKAVAFGADMVMVGGMFAGHDENPGDVVIDSNGDKMKVFFGSASEHQKGEKKYVEGKKMLVPYKGSIADTLSAIKQNLQSSISYSGGNKLEDLFSVEFVLLNQ